VQRQLDREAAAAADFALEIDAPAVRLHHVAHDREAEPRGSPRLLALCESFEDPLAQRARDPGTMSRTESRTRSALAASAIRITPPRGV
jgi:hypothetical protein